jgi:multicomponent Na+:H+ antiporter subunit B
MTVVVRGAVRVVSAVLLIVGVYLVAWGYSPGGGFPGGAVIAGVILLVYVGFGYRKVRKVVRPEVIEPLELGGALLIVLIESLGLVLKGSFSANFLPAGAVQTLQSGGVLQAFSGSELIEVSTGLTLAIFGLLSMGHDWSERDGDDDKGDGPDPS